ncbi:MAG: Gldg family protein, partial [Bacillota bacterium]|nr:Gldg family protein [Bacillota bacterium]
KNGMEILLITSPSKLSDIILGKYLSVLFIFFVIVGISFIYPVILLIFSNLSIITVIGQYLAFILLGASMIAFGIFISSLTENVITASIISFISLLIMMLIQPISNYFGGGLSKVLNWFSIFSRYDDLTRGIFGLDTILYYLSFIIVFLFLTVRTIEKRRWSKNPKYTFNSLILISSVIAIALLVNLIAEQNPIKIDLSANKLYSIGDTTKKIIGNLNKNVVIYGLIDDGKIDTDYNMVNELLNKYVINSKAHIKIKYVDSDKDTQIINQLDPNGTLQLKKNDFVITSGNKYKKLSYEDLFQVKMDNQSLSQYTTGSLAEQSFTGAIKYVTNEITPAVYFIEGNNEDNLESSYKTLNNTLEKNNYIVKSVNLATVQEIPNDAGILIFLSPKQDLSLSEKDKVAKFLNNGGKAAFLFNFINSNQTFTQFDNILKNYNLSLNYDRVKESDGTKHLSNDPYSLILNVESSKIIPLDFSGMLMSNSRSINILKNENQDIIVAPLIKTDDTSISEQVNKTTNTELKGPLNLAVSVENKTTVKPSQVIVLGSSLFLNESTKETYSSYFSTGNYFFISTLNWMQNNSGDVVIAAKPFNSGKISITEANGKIIAFFVIFVLPISILGYGLFVWLKRRHL